MTDFDLDRFLTAQERDFDKARAEIAAGRKTTHWIWYVYPQLKGLGRSEPAQYYGLDGLAEAEAYMKHPVLGRRLVEMCELLLTHADHPAEQILGTTDAMKVRSSATLFDRVSVAPDVFARVLSTFYEGDPDPLTLERL